MNVLENPQKRVKKYEDAFEDFLTGMPTMKQTAKGELEVSDNGLKQKAKQPNYTSKILLFLNKIFRQNSVLLSCSELLDLTKEELQENFNAFMELIDYINEQYDFSPTKQLFCAFLQTTTYAYNNLYESTNLMDLKDVIQSIEDYLVDAQFVASATGLMKEKTTAMRLKTKGNQGHNLQENKGLEGATFNIFGNVPSQQEMERRLSQTMGVKRLDNKGEK